MASYRHINPTDLPIVVEQPADNLIPTRDGIPILHNYLQFRAAPLQFWLDTAAIAPVVRVRFATNRELLVITDADLLGEMFQKKARQFPRSRTLIDKDNLDNSQTVFNAPTWDEWLWRRRMLQPTFHRKQLTGFAEAMVDETQRLVADWDGIISLKEQMKTLTMRIIGRTMFSAPLQQTKRLQTLFEQISRYSFAKSSAMIDLPAWLPTPLKVRTRKSLATRYDIIGTIVKERLASNEPKGDLLDTLIAASAEEGFSAENIIHEMNSVIFAGHETTAMTLTWLFHTLAQNPLIEQKVRAEVMTVLGNRPTTLADLDAMPYINNVIQETMRLYPSVYVTLREADGDQTLGDYDIPAGTELLANLRALHRDPRYWEAPLTFNPDRFNKPRHKFAYMPFLIGPRKCIGDSFAMMEMRLVVPTILQNVYLRTAGELPKEHAGFVMEPDNNVEMSITSSKG